MTSETEAILREALALRDRERAALVVELLASLETPSTDDPATVKALWAEEIDRRATAALSGTTESEEWATVRDRVAARLKG